LKYQGRRGNSERINLWIPSMVHIALEKTAVKEKCSKAWVVTRALMKEFNITQEDIDNERGYTLEKEFKDRGKEV
jgi:hypothetical protein